MAKVVFRSLRASSPAKKDTAVTVKRVRNPAGGKTTAMWKTPIAGRLAPIYVCLPEGTGTRARRLNKRLAERSGQAAADR